MNRPRFNSDLVVMVVGCVLALVPVIAVIVTRTGHHYLPLGDESTIDLRVRDVFTSNSPLVGAYSRGFNHPGPLLYWLLAPLSVVTGGAAWATLVGAAVLQGIGIAWSGWLGYRRGGLLLGLGVLAALGLAYSSFVLGVQFLQPWNPNVAFPFYMVFLLQVWSVALGSRWQIVGALVVATFLVQLHVSYLPLVAVPALWAAALVWSDHRRGRAPLIEEESPRWRTVFVVAGASMAALWLAVVYQQFDSRSGNLSALMRYFRDASGSIGLRAGAGLFAAEFRLPPPWLGGADRLAFLTERVVPENLLWLLVPTALLAVGFMAARTSASVADNRMLQLALVTAVTSIVAISRVNVGVQTFLFYWRVIAALFVVLAAAWAVANWAALDQRRVARACSAAILLVVIAGFFGVRARDDVLRHRDVLGPRDEYAEKLFERIDRAGLPDAPVLVRGLGTTTAGFAQGLVDELDRDGVAVRVDPESGFQYGDERTATPSDVAEVWYISPNGSNRSILDRYPNARLVASVSALAAPQERELRRLQREVGAQLEGIGRQDLAAYLDSSLFGVIVSDADLTGVDQRAVNRIARLNARVERSGGCRCVVIAFPAADAPSLPYSMGF